MSLLSKLSGSNTRCVHFLRGHISRSEISKIEESLASERIIFAHIDGATTDLPNAIGLALALDNCPYTHDVMSRRWVAFADDMITLRTGTRGLVLFIDNTSVLFSSNIDSAQYLIEFFLLPMHHWLDEGKPCHICFL